MCVKNEMKARWSALIQILVGMNKTIYLGKNLTGLMISNSIAALL